MKLGRPRISDEETVLESDTYSDGLLPKKAKNKLGITNFAFTCTLSLLWNSVIILEVEHIRDNSGGIIR